MGSPFNRPSITPAQIVAGIPLLANLLDAWGVFTVSAAQQSTLRDTMLWAFGLIAGDAVIRLGRNLSDGIAKRHVPDVIPPVSTGGLVQGSPPK